jgi:hypothetical protein
MMRVFLFLESHFWVGLGLKFNPYLPRFVGTKFLNGLVSLRMFLGMGNWATTLTPLVMRKTAELIVCLQQLIERLAHVDSWCSQASMNLFRNSFDSIPYFSDRIERYSRALKSARL